MSHIKNLSIINMLVDTPIYLSIVTNLENIPIYLSIDLSILCLWMMANLEYIINLYICL